MIETRMTVVLIDSSYYNFYRFFATVRWHNYSEDRKKAADGVYWLDNETFMKTFEKMWFEHITKICKKFSCTESDIIFARDGRDVWRYKIFPEYKAHRDDGETDEPHAPGPVFKYVNEHFHPRLVSTILRHEQAEGDDIIAICVRYIRAVFPNNKIVVITGDHDLLQLCEPPFVEIYKLNGKDYTKITTEPHLALMTKILAGDPSDNIPGIYKGCGKKTAERLAGDPKELREMLEKHGDAQYQLNCQLVDFDYIPQDIASDIEALLDDTF